MGIKTFFSDLAERGPLLIVGEEAYLVNSRPSPSNGNNLITFGNANLELVPAGTLSDLVRFYKHHMADQIYAEKKEFIEERVDQGFMTAEEREREIGDRKLFSFIVNELMPYLSGHKEDISELLGEEIERQQITEKDEVDEEELLENLERVKRELRGEQERYAKAEFQGDTTDEVSYLRSLLQGDVLALSGIVYKLEKSRNPQIIISVKGSLDQYDLREIGRVEDIDEEYARFLSWRSRLEAIDEFTDYIKAVQRIRLEATKDLDKIMQLREFNDGDVGFLRHEGDVYVYQIIPPFAMLDPRPTKKGVAYEFPRLRVGMRIQYEDGRIYLDEPVLFEAEWHPFTEMENAEFQHLCGGHVPPRNGSEVEWVAKALDDAKNLVMNGLTPGSIREHGGDKKYGGRYFGISLDEKLAPRKISEKEARRKGLLITNRWDWRDD
ncbi:hypothetical protein D6745_00435 [Candidatus Woesearchaeota archaeon]|nr:MAG: hypothetical protein D6745_00435 [Candidatus Woesearchaeota archaeon]